MNPKRQDGSQNHTVPIGNGSNIQKMLELLCLKKNYNNRCKDAKVKKINKIK